MSNPANSFIWYELLTVDPAESKRFYDAVTPLGMSFPLHDEKTGRVTAT